MSFFTLLYFPLSFSPVLRYDIPSLGVSTLQQTFSSVKMEFKGHKYTKGIFWLPKKSEIDQGFLLDVNIPTRAYNHPVLILSHKPGGRGYLDMVDLVIVR